MEILVNAGKYLFPPGLYLHLCIGNCTSDFESGSETLFVFHFLLLQTTDRLKTNPP